jgi:hypothetical protein
MNLGGYDRNSAFKEDRTISRVRITKAMIKIAEERAGEQGDKYYSGLGPEADLKGCLGEVVAEYWMDKNNIEYKSELNSKKHDYRLKNSQYTFDVKTKDRNVRPERKYDCTVPFYNHTFQRSDFFLFVSLQSFYGSRDLKGLKKFEFAYIVGSITYEELKYVGVSYLHDEQDWTNGTVMWTTALNVLMYQLISVKDTVQLFKSDRNVLSQIFKNIQDKKPNLIPLVELNSKLVESMRLKIKSNQLLDRPFPPWTESKHNRLKEIGSMIERKKLFNPLDKAVVALRLNDIQTDLANNDIQQKNYRSLFIYNLKEKGHCLHPRALPDLLKRYKLFFKSDCYNYISSPLPISEVLKGGLSQRKYIRKR